MKKVVLLALGAVLALLSLVGCAPSIDQEDILGVWFTPSFWMEFHEDGFMWVADSRVALRSENTLIAKDEFMLDGNTITLTGEADGACPGLVGEYAIELTDDGNLLFEVLADACLLRQQAVDDSEWAPRE